MKAPRQNRSILLIEKSIPLSNFIQQTLEENSKDFLDMLIIDDWASAVDYLNQKAASGNNTGPGLILIGILGQKDPALKFLKKLKSNPATRNYPVIAYSPSLNQSFISGCYNDHVNSIIYRSDDENAFAKVLKSLFNFWFSVVVPPISNWEM